MTTHRGLTKRSIDIEEYDYEILKDLKNFSGPGVTFANCVSYVVGVYELYCRKAVAEEVI